MLPRIDRREVMRQDEDGEWICPKGEEVLQMAGVLTIEAYVHSGEERDDHEIRKMRNIYGKCKSSRMIATYFGWIIITIAMTLQRLSRARRPTVNPPCMRPASTQTSC
jgi:hypothetical protein